MTPELLRLVDNSYWLHELLGEGGMATVYRATYRLNGDSVALKLVSDERFGTPEDATSDGFNLRLALLREFQTLASLHHPNIVEVLGYGIDEGRTPYFTMEILKQPQNIVEAAQGQPLGVKLDLLVQLLRALTYVHRRGLLHRDIKPSNAAIARDWTSNDPQRREVLANHRLRYGSVFGSLGGLSVGRLTHLYRLRPNQPSRAGRRVRSTPGCIPR